MNRRIPRAQQQAAYSNKYAAASSKAGLTRRSVQEAIKQCMSSRNLEQARTLHSQSKAAGNSHNIYVASSLVTLFAKCGSMVEAKRIFDSISTHDVALWTVLILGYAENGQPDLALEAFANMIKTKCRPDSRAFVSAIKACSCMAVESPHRKMEALEIAFMLSSQADLRNTFIGNSMLNLLAKCGCMAHARKFLDCMQQPDIISWNSVLLGYVEGGDERAGLDLYVEIRSRSVRPNARTFSAVLKACAGLAAGEKYHDGVKIIPLEIGMALHSEARKFDVHSEIFVATTLVDMYSSCGSLEDAKHVFDAMTVRSVVSWNSLLRGYAEGGSPEKTLDFFFDRGQYRPESRSFSAVLKACGMMQSVEATRRVHSEVCRAGLESEDVLVSSLVDAYGKCGGRMVEARLVFDSVSSGELICWSALVAGYSREGNSERVFEMFSRMREERLKVDAVIVLSVLASCSHSGLVDEGKKCFGRMRLEFGVSPGAEHYDCMVDMLGRANRLEEALAVVESMPFKPSVVTWKTLLSACRKWKNADVGRVAFESVVRMNENDAGAYMLMADTFD